MKVGRIQKTLSRQLFLLASVCAFVFLGVPKAHATTSTDPLFLNCNPSTDCTQSPTNNQLVSSGLPSFTLSEQGTVTSGTLTAYFVVVVPTSASVSFSVNGTSDSSATSVVMTSTSNSNLFSALGLSYPSSFVSSSLPTFSTFNTSAGQVIGSQTSFTAYVFDVGSCSSCTSISNISISITGTALPPGTTFYAYLTDTNGPKDVVSTTDYSETITVVPEPATLGLVGCGLLLLGLVIRRREVGKS